MRGRHVLLTGATGFVGKVVLEELLRQEELAVDSVYLLIRPARGITVEQRFKRLMASPCFAAIAPHRWQLVRIVSGDMSQPGCGLSAADRAVLLDKVTQIINCAASVDFDLDLAAASTANIISSLRALELAQSCCHLESMVNVSTAYVTPHPGDDRRIDEELVKLPRSANSIFESIQKGTAKREQLLAETGHPNTYTLTKCVSEHLLMERRGSVPLTIIRPSIISASWRYPFAGWIDSMAAFAGFIALIGSGHLRAMIGRRPTYLDLVPCDEVVARIIHSAFHPPREAVIRHAVAGRQNSCSIQQCIPVVEGFFRPQRAKLFYVGSKNWLFFLHDFQHHKAPMGLLRLWYGLRKERRKRKEIDRVIRTIDYLNRVFPYFTHNNFNFYSSMPLVDAAFNKEKYIETICSGVHRHLMVKMPTKAKREAKAKRPGKKEMSASGVPE